MCVAHSKCLLHIGYGCFCKSVYIWLYILLTSGVQSWIKHNFHSWYTVIGLCKALVSYYSVTKSFILSHESTGHLGDSDLCWTWLADGLAGSWPIKDGLTCLSDFSVLLIRAWSLWWHGSKKEYGNAHALFSSHYFCQFLLPYHWSKQVTWPTSDLACDMTRGVHTETCEKLKPWMHLI